MSELEPCEFTMSAELYHFKLSGTDNSITAVVASLAATTAAPLRAIQHRDSNGNPIGISIYIPLRCIKS